VNGSALRRQLVREESGFALMIAVVLMMLLATIAVAVLDQAMAESTHSRTAQTQDGSYQAAEAGLNAYMAKLLEDAIFYDHYLIGGEASRTVSGVAYNGSGTTDVSFMTAPVGVPWTYASKNVWTDPTVYLKGSGYQYDIEVCQPVVSGSPACGGIFGGGTNPYLRIVSTGRPVNNTDKRTWRAIELDVKPFSLTDFQMFSKASVSYGSTATTYGPVYSQGDVNHSGKALADVMAEGNVSGPSLGITPPARVYDVNTSPNIRHAPGLSTEPAFNNFLGSEQKAKPAAQASGTYLNDTTKDAFKLVFASNGTVQISSCKKAVVNNVAQDIGAVAPVCTLISAPTVPPYGAIYSEQSLIVEGTLLGRVTIVSAKDIVVSNNITYASSDSVLGMIASNDVVVAQYTPDTLTWHGAVIAQNGQRHSYSNDGSHSTQNFYGSTTTNGSPSMDMFRTRNY
jgi:Tfp pilus assembly protein PilX